MEMILIDQARDIRRIAHALEAMNERRVKTPFNEDKLIVQIMVCLKEEEQKLADQLEAEDDDGATQGWIEALEWVLATIARMKAQHGDAPK